MRNVLGATARDGQKPIIFAGGTFNCDQHQRRLKQKHKTQKTATSSMKRITTKSAARRKSHL